MNYEIMRIEFEKSASKKGYCFELDDCGKYVDIYLQEAWEIFASINLKPLLTPLSK